MPVTRNVFKHSGILMTFWSSSRSWSETKKFVVMCHGCPSHPFDHTPACNGKLLESGVVLVYPNYIGTWGSNGVCSFENAVDTVLEVVRFIKSGIGVDARSKKTLNWNPESILLVGASFGGSVVLCAGARSPDVAGIVSCSPVIDWKEHNSTGDESPLEETVSFIRDAYDQLWRCDEESLEKFARGEIRMNPIEYADELQSKRVLLIHDRRDPQILWQKVDAFAKTVAPKENILHTQDQGRHILLHHLDETELFEKIRAFTFA